MTPLRVILADDHPVFRAGLRSVLTANGIEVVGEASNGDEAVAAVEEGRPDIVLLDLAMPGSDGFDAARKIAAGESGAAILVVTMSEDDDSLFAAMQAGAAGYLLKGARPEEILSTISAVAAGGAAFGPGIASRVLHYFAGMRRSKAHDAFPELSRREVEVLELIAAGSSNSVIAANLHLAEKTVRNHVSSIFTKLQVADRAAAIVRARRAGLGDEASATEDG